MGWPKLFRPPSGLTGREAPELAVTGTGLGILLAYRLLALIVAWMPEHMFPQDVGIHINAPVLLFSAGLALVTAVLFGLIPALQMAKPEISQVMQSNSSKTAGSVRGKRLHGSLVAAQSQAGPRDLGVATGTLLLTRAMGGAFGATMADALLAIAHRNLAYGFRLGFLACAVLEAVAVAVALRMEDIQLRQTLEVAPAAEAH